MRAAIFLFDVDGTLLQAGSRYHNQALVAAVEQVCGRTPNMDGLPLAGRTDTEIVLDMVATTGLEASPSLLPAIFEASVADFEVRCPADISELVIAGVRPALEALAADGAAIGLVTGNVEAIARRKLEAAGLRGFFSFGAFGDESGRRADLPPLAVARAGLVGDGRRTYVIGDTPLDVDCGEACGMTTVAVATGRYSLAELQACRPSFACASLDGFIAALRAGDL